MSETVSRSKNFDILFEKTDGGIHFQLFPERRFCLFQIMLQEEDSTYYRINEHRISSKVKSHPLKISHESF